MNLTGFRKPESDVCSTCNHKNLIITVGLEISRYSARETSLLPIIIGNTNSPRAVSWSS